MTELLTASLIPIFFIIALGYVAGLTGMVDNKHVRSLNTVVMDFALPAAMFGAVSKASRGDLLQQWVLVIVLAVGLLMIWIFVYALCRYVFKQSPSLSAVIAMTVGLPNSAAAGIPLMNAVFGLHGRIPTVMGIAVGAIVLVPLTMVVLDLGHSAQEGGADSAIVLAIAKALGRAAFSPLILAPLAALVLVEMGLHIPEALESSFELLGAAAASVALLLTGLVLSVQRPQWKLKIAGAVIVANIAHPALSWILAKLLQTTSFVTHTAILLSALPAGFFGILFALRYDQDLAECSSIVAISTIFSIVTLGAAIALTRLLAV